MDAALIFARKLLLHQCSSSGSLKHWTTKNALASIFCCWGIWESPQLQGGPLPVVDGVITPIRRVITPITHLFSAIYKGYHGLPVTVYISHHLQLVFRGPPCTISTSKILSPPSTSIFAASAEASVSPVTDGSGVTMETTPKSWANDVGRWKFERSINDWKGFFGIPSGKRSHSDGWNIPLIFQ